MMTLFSLFITSCGEAQFGKLVEATDLSEIAPIEVSDDVVIIVDGPGQDQRRDEEKKDEDKKEDEKKDEDKKDDDKKDEDKKPEEKAPEKKVDDAIVKCQQAKELGKLITITPRVVFNESKGCPWGQADNNQDLDNWINARTEKVQSVKLEDKFTVCDMKFESDEQDMQYDDEIMLMLGDVVLFSSVDYSQDHRLANQSKYAAMGHRDLYKETDGLQSEDGLVIYQWAGKNGIIRNKNLAAQDPRPSYCLGGGNCQIPESQTSGKIDIDIPQASILKAAAKSGVKVDEVGSSQLDFKFVVTGDNDKSVDCTHRDFDFDVSVTGYIVE